MYDIRGTQDVLAQYNKFLQVTERRARLWDAISTLTISGGSIIFL